MTASDRLNLPLALSNMAAAPARPDGIGVVVRRLGPGQWHSGLLLGNVRTGPQMLHLGWHHDLSLEPMRTSYGWVQLRLPTRRVASVSALARLVHSRYGNDRPRAERVPYALRYQGAVFERRGGRANLLLRGGKGLSCATFVLAVLEGASVPLIDATQWNTMRPGDQERFDIMIAMMKADSNVQAEHVQQCELDGASPRIRPEEVAGAATFDLRRFPVGLTDAERVGVVIDLAFAGGSVPPATPASPPPST